MRACVRVCVCVCVCVCVWLSQLHEHSYDDIHSQIQTYIHQQDLSSSSKGTQKRKALAEEDDDDDEDSEEELKSAKKKRPASKAVPAAQVCVFKCSCIWCTCSCTRMYVCLLHVCLSVCFCRTGGKGFKFENKAARIFLLRYLFSAFVYLCIHEHVYVYLLAWSNKVKQNLVCTADHVPICACTRVCLYSCIVAQEMSAKDRWEKHHKTNFTCMLVVCVCM